jgi:protein gp37
MQKTKIEWADYSYNPIVGCSKVSAGCARCYAERMAMRFRKSGMPFEGVVDRFGWTGLTRFFPERLDQPFHWRKPRRIFVCSMSDLFHESLTDEQIAAVFGVMAATPQHQYVVLTKRLQRAVEWFTFGLESPETTLPIECLSMMAKIVNSTERIRYKIPKWPLENVIMCASVEDQPTVDELVPLLLQIPARWRGVSVEPMLESIDLYMDMYESETGYWHAHDCPNYCDYSCDGFTSEGGIDLVICGAETGPCKRPFKDEWALDLRDQCKAAGTPFFFKKDGSGKPTLCGVEYHEWVK